MRLMSRLSPMRDSGLTLVTRMSGTAHKNLGWPGEKSGRTMIKWSIVFVATWIVVYLSSCVAAFKSMAARNRKVITRRVGYYRPARASTELSSFFTSKDPSDQVLEAIDSLPRNSRKAQIRSAMVADVATAAGVSLGRAEKECFLLAAALGSSMNDEGRTSTSVTADGELVFSFAAPVKTELARASKAYQLRQAWKSQIWPKLFHFLRVSFGAAYYSTLVGASAYLVLSEPNFPQGILSGRSLLLVIVTVLYFAYYGPDFFSGPRELESVFSHVFGEGNPNERIHEQQLHKAATYIRGQGGAVVAEQLVPFLLESIPHPPPPEYVSSTLTEQTSVQASVLPIVGQFQGKPLVAENGDIVYVFPALQVTMQKKSAATMVSTKDRLLLQEQKYMVDIDGKIDSFTAQMRFLRWLPLALSTTTHHLPVPLYCLIFSFNVFRGIRCSYIQRENEQIQRRNDWRKQWQFASESWLKRKVQSANEFRTEMKRIDDVDDTVYETTNLSVATSKDERG
jgi:hypothetical protein